METAAVPKICAKKTNPAIASFTVLAASILLSLLLHCFSQAQLKTESKPSFDVASVKLSTLKGGWNSTIEYQAGGRFVATNYPLVSVIAFAYSITSYQVIGVPDRIRSDRWDIDARPGQEAAPSQAMAALMLQSLLEDRFKLKFHRETRMLPIYEIVISKGGLKIKPSDDQSEPKPFSVDTFDPLKPPRGTLTSTIGFRWGTAVDFSDFIILTGSGFEPRKPVVDRTGLKGRYDIKLKWTPSDSEIRPGQRTPPPDSPFAIDPSGPSIFTALEQQLGLKVNSTKAPYEVLVIDSVQKPSEN